MTAFSPFRTFTLGSERSLLQTQSSKVESPRAAVQYLTAAVPDAALATNGSDVQEADFAKFAFRPTTVASGKPKRCIAIFLKLPLALGCSILASYRSAVRTKLPLRN